jgi:uncharacterized protein YkwD
MDETTARQILGVSSDAGPAEIRAAFREQARQEHPDQSADPEATERFKKLTKARAVLLDERPSSASPSESFSSGDRSDLGSSETESTDQSSGSDAETAEGADDSASSSATNSKTSSASGQTRESSTTQHQRQTQSVGDDVTADSTRQHHWQSSGPGTSSPKSASWSRPQTAGAPARLEGPYWGQIALALVASLVGSYLLFQSGVSQLSTVVIAALLYTVVRWTLTWLHRTLDRYTAESEYARRCPNCRTEQRRQSRQWILECENCGQKAGVPGLRWLTHSVPAYQLQQTVFGPKLLVVVVAAGLLVSGVTAGVAVTDIAGGLSPAGFTTDDPGEDSTTDPADTVERTPTSTVEAVAVSGDDDSASTPAQPSTPTPKPLPASRINESEIEALVLERINEERASRNLGELDELPALHDIASGHSQDMNERDFRGHTNPDGEGPSDRGAHIETCLVQGDAAIGEILADGTVREGLSSSVSDATFDARSAEGIAHYLVDAWLNSPEHRELMLRFGLDYMGVGVDITGDEFVGTVNVC